MAVTWKRVLTAEDDSSSFDNYSQWTIEADSGGTTGINSGNNVQFIGGSAITTSRSGNDITIDLDSTFTIGGELHVGSTSGDTEGRMSVKADMSGVDWTDGNRSEVWESA